MSDMSYICTFTSVNKEEVDFSLICKSNMLPLAINQINSVINYYKGKGIEFNLNISSHKPIKINVKK